jgi:hypothetical protein
MPSLYFPAQDIRTERLTSDFLAHRTEWARILQEFAENDRVDEDAALVASHSPHQSPTFSTPQSDLAHQFSALDIVEDVEVGFEADVHLVVQLTKLGYPTHRCITAVRATQNAGVDAALEWLFDHPESPQMQSRANSGIESPTLAPMLRVLRGSNPSPGTAGVAVPRSVRCLLDSIAALHAGITLSPATTNLTRAVFTIFMSRKLPRDVCWLIFSYTASAHDIRAILLDKDFTAPASAPRDEYNYLAHYGTWPVLRQPAHCVTADFLRYASHYLHIRQPRISGAKTSQ